MPKRQGYEDPAVEGGGGNPPGKAKGAEGGANGKPGSGYVDPNESKGKSQEPVRGNSSATRTGYDQAGTNDDNSKAGPGKTKNPYK